MNDPHPPANVAVLAFPEASASVVYGTYDVVKSAGRDWGIIVEGKPGLALIRPRVVSANAGPFAAANDVPITPETTLDDMPSPDVACVPELNVPPGEPLEGRFTAESPGCNAVTPRARRSPPRARVRCSSRKLVFSIGKKRRPTGLTATSSSITTSSTAWGREADNED
jgi:hypothetical protein